MRPKIGQLWIATVLLLFCTAGCAGARRLLWKKASVADPDCVSTPDCISPSDRDQPSDAEIKSHSDRPLAADPKTDPTAPGSGVEQVLWNDAKPTIQLATVQKIATWDQSTEGDEFDSIAQTGFHLFHDRPPLGRETIDLGLGDVSIIVDPCGMRYLAPYLDRVDQFAESALPAAGPWMRDTGAQGCPPPAWWENEALGPSRADASPVTVDLESLIVRTLANSRFLKALSDLPLIREKSTLEAIAEFDVTSFIESRFDRPSDPVGNELTVGPGRRRLRENDFSTSAGIGRKTPYGGRVELAQQVGLLNNNSEFIDPRHQGNSRLTLNISQPLLSGAGRAYNTSLIVLAEMDERVAWDEVSEQLQDYVVEVTDNYWQLYLERSRLLQKERQLRRGEVILAELEQRRDFDAVASQIARVRSAVNTRRSELIRAQTLVRNVESRLRGLVNDPELYGAMIEIVPVEAPRCTPLDITLPVAMSQALQSRAEIDKALQKVRAAGVRLSVARNELQPILDVMLETYVSGLRGDNDIGRAWVDQFSVGEPSYAAGVRYEIPINNRLAKNRHERRRLEMRQAISEFEFEVEELSSAVEIAVRELSTTYDELLSRFEAMHAAEIDLEYFSKRWELLPGDNRNASFLLEDILEAQNRVTVAESNFAQTQVNYAMAIVRAKREMGILLQNERIHTTRSNDGALEQYLFMKVESPDDASASQEPERPADSATVSPVTIPFVPWQVDEQEFAHPMELNSVDPEPPTPSYGSVPPSIVADDHEPEPLAPNANQPEPLVPESLVPETIHPVESGRGRIKADDGPRVNESLDSMATESIQSYDFEPVAIAPFSDAPKPFGSTLVVPNLIEDHEQSEIRFHPPQWLDGVFEPSNVDPVISPVTVDPVSWPGSRAD